MESFDLYKDISHRTNGDIYIGVVGPVRTGKSTFIKNFMDIMVLPNIQNEYVKERTLDELPQSATGRTVMTTEPKFVPNEAVEISLDEDVSFNVRLIDCVGYMVDGALGHMNEDGPRMVSTPWSDERIPFEEAAEIGTKKVITDHSTIGVVLTTDGSITDIERESYVHSEERVVSELKELNKPFVMIINTSRPFSEATEELRDSLSEKYSIPVLAMNCATLKRDDINTILEKVLYEFPLREIRLNYPKWVETLTLDHWLKSDLVKNIKSSMASVSKLREVKNSLSNIENCEFVKKAYIEGIYLGEGSANIEVSVNDNLFYRVLSETTDMDIGSEYELISTMKTLATAKKEYDKIKYALEEVNHRGYGIVTPSLDEMKLDAPVLVKHGNKYGVKIKATAPSIHLIRADIETEVSPIVGSEEQSKDLIEYLNTELHREDGKIWELNMFGKSMQELVREGLQNKLYRMPDEAQMKLQETLQRIINEDSNGVLCIIL